jgi:hypothetical protein
MTCDQYHELSSKDAVPEGDERRLAGHLETCPPCREKAERDALVADAVVAAAAARSRFQRRLRRAGTAALAAAILLAGALAVRLARRPAIEVRYVIRGDSTGIVLTGPGIERRGETLPTPSRKGDRL